MADSTWRAIDHIEVDGVVIPGDHLKPIERFALNVEKGELEVTLRGKDIRIIYADKFVTGGRD